MSKQSNRIATLQAEADQELDYAARLSSVLGGGDETVQFCLLRRERLLEEIRSIRENMQSARRKREARQWLREMKLRA